jgi:HJR/Mrr/RecB family endonuclease
MKRTMFARVSDMTVRLASIVAFGRGSRTVDEPDMLWARAITMRSAQEMYEAVLKHMEDPKSHNAMCQEILDMFAESPDVFVARRDIARKTRKYKAKGGDLTAALDQLVVEERIVFELRTTGGRSSPGYRLLQD